MSYSHRAIEIFRDHFINLIELFDFSTDSDVKGYSYYYNKELAYLDGFFIKGEDETDEYKERVFTGMQRRLLFDKAHFDREINKPINDFSKKQKYNEIIEQIELTLNKFNEMKKTKITQPEEKLPPPQFMELAQTARHTQQFMGLAETARHMNATAAAANTQRENGIDAPLTGDTVTQPPNRKRPPPPIPRGIRLPKPTTPVGMGGRRKKSRSKKSRRRRTRRFR